MRQLTKVDVILHKVGINTRCFIYWSKPKAEECICQLKYNNLVLGYRKFLTILNKYNQKVSDCVIEEEYDKYINKGMHPIDAYSKITVKYFEWK